MCEWKETKLGDLISIKGGFSYKGKYIGSGSSLLLGMGCVSFTETFLYSGARLYSAESPDTYLAEPGDIVLATRQQSDILPILGAPAIIPDALKGKRVIVGTNLYKVVNESTVTNDFLFWLLKSTEYRNHIDSCAKGSTVKMITKDAVESYKFLCPSEKERNVIANTLWQIENKIGLLHRQNATIEQMAATLFKQWFMEEMTDGNMTTLKQFAENIRINVKTEDLKNFHHYVGLEHVPRKNIVLSEWGTTNAISSNKSVFKKNDILFGKLRSYFHKVVFAPFDGVCSTDILVIRPKKEEWFPFCLFWFFSEELVEFSDLGSGGTRMPRTNWDIISNYQIPNPSLNQIEKFNEIVRPFFEKINKNINQIRTLTKLRDTLLPKLMSGEVRVKL